VNVLPAPAAVLGNDEVTCALRRVVAVVDPLLDLLESDPVGLKGRTGSSADPVGRVLDAAAWVLDAADVPGTKAWDELTVDERVSWWVHRVGALDTVVVASPGVFGVLADRLPVQDALGFASQAIVLCAVAREHGVTDRDDRVRLLAAVLCDRDLDVAAPRSDPGDGSDAVHVDWSPVGIGKALWQVAGLLRATGDELVKRPRPRWIFRYLGMLPAAGAIADYLGEYGALVRAAKQGQAWLAHRPAA
jgi:hypothetical protein